MHQKGYLYHREGQTKYTFTSCGKRNIVKLVNFTPTEYTHIMNFGFADLMPDGTADDVSESNNGDMIVVLATIIEILKTFLIENHQYAVFFMGSTAQRMLVYQRIIKTYYKEFDEIFLITGLILEEEGLREELFDVNTSTGYFAFLIKKNI